ncbi:MATE family efflux transporter [Cellulosimicrobium sp. SH8]|uniref:MATE family efflux transporter n=1 Tax=Cellulosimicrobium sp. SH8 TaxID=2952936 RepID=UPI0021F25441|nr:MATE family efflux transporter [Cellulosimicrobium sp. SH8]
MPSSSREAAATPVATAAPREALPPGPPPPVGGPTVGALRRRVVRLAAPICAALVVGALAQLVIAALLGHMGDDALYVRSLFIPVTFLVLAVQEGLDVSTQVGFARLHGSQGRAAGDDTGDGTGDGGTAVVPTSATTALLGRFVAAGAAVLGGVALVVVLAAPALAGVLSVPAPLVAEFVAFARWTVLASVLSVPTAVAAAALRGWARTGASATVALLVAGLQVLVVWLVGLVAGFGALAVPVAITGSTLVGAAVAWALLVRARLLPRPGHVPGLRRLLALRHHPAPQRLAAVWRRALRALPSGSWTTPTPPPPPPPPSSTTPAPVAAPSAPAGAASSDPHSGPPAAEPTTAGVPPEGAVVERVDVRGLLLGVGLPVGLSYLLLTVTNLVMVWVLGPSGTDVVAGYGGAATVQTLVIVPAIGLAAAVSIVMNQQWGAGDLGLLPRTLRAGTVVVAGVYVAVGVLVLLTAPFVAGRLSADPDVAAQAALYLRVVGPSYAGVGLVLYLLTLLEQLGYGRVAVTLNVLYHAVSLGVGGVLARAGGGPTALYTTIAVMNVVGLVVMLPVAVRLVRRRAAGQPTEPAEEAAP